MKTTGGLAVGTALSSAMLRVSVSNVQPLAARETSNSVGNLLSVIEFNRQPKAAPVLPAPQPVTPQKICVSSTLRRGWEVYPER